MARPFLFLPLFLLACSPAADDGTTLSPDEDRQLNQAASDLDVNMIGNTAP